MPFPFIIPAIALGTGILNAVNANSHNQKIDDYINDLNDTKITGVEVEEELDTVGDLFNTKILSERNKSAPQIALSGAVNPEVFQLALESELLGKRQLALAEKRNEIFDFNKRIDLQIDQAGLGKISPVEAFTSGALGGVGLGLSVESLMSSINMEEKQFDLLSDYLNEDSSTATLKYLGQLNSNRIR